MADHDSFSLALGVTSSAGRGRELLGWFLIPVGCSLGGGSVDHPFRPMVHTKFSVGPLANIVWNVRTARRREITPSLLQKKRAANPAALLFRVSFNNFSIMVAGPWQSPRPARVRPQPSVGRRSRSHRRFHPESCCSRSLPHSNSGRHCPSGLAAGLTRY